MPRGGAYLTNYWGQEDIIVDERVFVLPTEIKDTVASIRLGFYSATTNNRLPRIKSNDQLDYVQVSINVD